MDKFVWVGSEGPIWMQGGSYVVARRIRIALEHWDKTGVDFQEQVIGRQKLSRHHSAVRMSSRHSTLMPLIKMATRSSPIMRMYGLLHH